MVILGLDLGTTTGWALYRDGGVVASGFWSLKAPKNAVLGHRYREFDTLLRGTIVREGVQRVAYEDVKAHAGVIAAHVYGGLLGTMEIVCGDLGVSVLGLGVGQIKKHATGKGNAGKETMVLVARRQWPDWDRGKYDHNEADARWIVELAAHETLNGESKDGTL